MERANYEILNCIFSHFPRFSYVIKNGSARITLILNSLLDRPFWISTFSMIMVKLRAKLFSSSHTTRNITWNWFRKKKIKLKLPIPLWTIRNEICQCIKTRVSSLASQFMRQQCWSSDQSTQGSTGLFEWVPVETWYPRIGIPNTQPKWLIWNITMSE